jgi:ubiquinol-cytochrome c reductase cytochrome b subunit
MASRIIQWFTDRWPVKPVLRWSLEEQIPGGDTFWYSLGAATLFVFVLQVVTGIWQLFWYVPTTEHAYQSVMYIRQEVPFGWLIHGLHSWGSNAFIVLVFLHILRVFVWGAYKHPRQLTWLVGTILLLLVLALTFTGALLPWDELGYWAAEVGTSIAGTVPIVGFFIKELMRGGADMNQATLSRFFIAHVAILPGILGALIAVHVVAFRQYGSVGPWNEEKRKKFGWFWPDQIVKDLIVMVVIFVALVGLSAFWRAPVTGPADRMDNITTPKPEWQFLFLYQFLKLFKGRWEPVGTAGVPLLLFLILFLLPFYDRNGKRDPFRRPIAMAGAIVLLAWLGIYTFLGYLSNPGAAATATVKVSSSASPGVKAGAELFANQGCVACHTVHGQGGSVGPDLSNIGAQGLSRTWLTQQIRDPKSHDPTTAMPAFGGLSDQQVSHLVDFLEGLGGGAGGSPSSTPPPSSQQSGEPNARAGTSPSTSGDAASNLVAQGQLLIRSQSCLGCHTINGQGGDVGPDLSNEGTKGRSQEWLTEQIRDPKSHNATTVMPSSEQLTDQRVKGLVAYLESLGAGAAQGTSSPAKPRESKPESSPSTSTSAGSDDPNATPISGEPNVPATGRQGPPGRAAYVVGQTIHGIGTLGAPMHGELLYDKWCQRCHGQDGKDNVSNPGSTDGTVPPLNPIDPSLYSDDPLTFAENIDRYIQHGSMPEGPAPEKFMPAWGDDLKLTQEMISEIEAYILKLNGVDRAKIMTPGVRPWVFFLICLIAFALAISARGMYTGGNGEGPTESAPTGSNSERPEAIQTERDIQNESSEVPSERRHPSSGPSLSFAVVVVITVVIVGTTVAMIFNTFVTTRPIPAVASAEAMKQHRVPQSSGRVTFNPPALADAPADMRDAINRGHSILMDTRKQLPQYVGSKLDCANCHFQAGATREALSLVGVTVVYPRFDPRQGRSIDLVERTNQCFERSLNGKALPADGNDMQAVMAYYQWISKGIPVYADVPWLGLTKLQSSHRPEPLEGKKLFPDKCGPCHGQDGLGTKIAPPVWGDRSFNDSAGMAQLPTFAAFTHALMPKGNPNLTVDEALDIAAYVTSQPRPGFKGSEPNAPSKN